MRTSVLSSGLDELVRAFAPRCDERSEPELVPVVRQLPEAYDRHVVPLLLALAFAAPQTPVPPWIERSHVAPTQFIVTYRLADVLGSPVVEGITVDRDPTDGTLNVSVIDSRFDPPQVVKDRSVKGRRLRWLRAGKRDGLFRYEIAIDAVDKGKETAYLFRVGRAFQLELVRTVRGHNLSPRTFSQ
jgi:hypothetical protein